jgi:hypothetical protein
MCRRNVILRLELKEKGKKERKIKEKYEVNNIKTF